MTQDDRPAIIDVGFRVEGLHSWSGATGSRAYLAHPHRHQFHVRVSVKVAHDDRQIEFHDLKDEAEAIFRTLGPGGNFGGQSCEMMARKLGTSLAAAHAAPVRVHVSEDGECGATVDVIP